jgi:hypothetical protein
MLPVRQQQPWDIAPQLQQFFAENGHQVSGLVLTYEYLLSAS